MTATELVCTSFDYAEVAKGGDRAWLRRAVTEIKYRLRCTVAEIVEAGRVLLDARARLKHGVWRRWVEAEVGLPHRTTNRICAVAKVFGRVVKDVLNRFTPTALYRLAEPGVPQPIREYMVEQASDRGATAPKVTAAEVTEVLACYHEKARDIGKAKLRKMEVAGEIVEDAKLPVDEEDVYAGENWLLLKRMIEQNATIHITSTTDDENGTLTVNFTAIDSDGKRRSETADVPEKVLLKLSRVERGKKCSKCGVPHPLEDFSKLKSSPDGRNSRCKMCERERVKDHEAKKNGGGVRTAKAHHHDGPRHANAG